MRFFADIRAVLPFLVGFAALAMATAAATPAVAQSQFSTAIRVNDTAITRYEVQQRIRFLGMINTLGDLDQQARDALIDERLQQQAARAAGLQLPPEAVETEMSEFAGRGNLSLAQFRSLLADNGVAFESFQKFARTRVEWRELMSTRFGGQVQISEAEIDRALNLASGGGGLRVLLSEFVLPLNASNPEETMALAEDFSRTLRSAEQFERAVRRFSASPSRADGGRVEWLNLAGLPSNIASVLLTMSPGDVSPPIRLPQAVVIFRLRQLAEAAPTRTNDAALDYAVIRLPHGNKGNANARMRDTLNRADTCNDLYGILADLPAENLIREVRAPAAIPAAQRRVLDGLDAGEFSGALAGGPSDETLFLMMCGRSAAINTDSDRQGLANQLRVQRLESLAQSYLSELRAAAVIETR